ncbi:hypothetical protein [Rahnella sp. RcJ3]|uniref:hypothetical protein n=1 Tax=Rahnella sp. RcJ3 TaxID=2292446 RepID=UPI001297B856|nr:hypothetical protein [Rahnella sp. RcJ3]MQB55285.1 hypothetical protein [Rahnella sp. RcJ3]
MPCPAAASWKRYQHYFTFDSADLIQSFTGTLVQLNRTVDLTLTLTLTLTRADGCKNGIHKNAWN